MKILHLIDHMGLGGAQNLILDLVEAKSSNIDYSVWSLSDKVLPLAAKRLKAAGVPLRTLGLSKYNPLDLLKLRMLLAKEQPNLLHTHLQFSSTFGIAAAVSLGRHRPIIVNHIHNDPFQHYTLWQRVGCKIIASGIDVQITPSQSIRDNIKKFSANHTSRIEVITPGLNLTTLDKTPADTARVKYLRGGAKRVIGTAGRLTKQKAVHVLLEATLALLKAEPATRILIAGEGPLRQTLERQAEHLKISHAVKFLGYQSEMVPVYQAMDVFVLPSCHEGFGIVLIEAMALQIPVIASRVVGIVDAIQDDVTGLLIPFGDPEALVSAISRIFTEPLLKERLIKKAVEFVTKTCSRKLMAEKIEVLYIALQERNKTITSAKFEP
ncbi:MAG: glycosyltransferase [Planctomycetota bacterium]|jgi:glycosyltransferase involved in cell wall biosynthesis